MPGLIEKDKSKSLLDEDSTISDVITEAFDNIELTTIAVSYTHLTLPTNREV